MSQQVFSPDEINASRQLLYMHGIQGGYPPGSFAEHLIRAMMHADHTNLAKLTMVFPEYQKGVFIMQQFGADSLAKALNRHVEAEQAE